MTRVMLGAATSSGFWVALSVLAAWRLTSLLCYEEGPFRSLVHVRRLLYSLRLGTLIDCFHCAGLWLSALMCFVVFRWSTEWPVLALAVAGGVSLLELAVSARRDGGSGKMSIHD